MNKPKAEIPSALLEYCELPKDIPKDLNAGLEQEAKNNQIIAVCFLMQKNLVDAILRRKETQ